MKYRAAKRTVSESHGWSILALACAAYLVTLPFIVGFDGLDKFRVPKDVYTALAVVVLVSVYLLTQPLKLRFQPRSWEFLAGLALCYVALHVVLGSRSEVGFPGLLSLAVFAVLLFVLIPVASATFQETVWLWIAGATGVNAVLTVLQYHGIFPWLERATGELLQGRLNPAGMIGEVNSGGFLFGLVCFPLLHGVFAAAGRRRRRLSGFLLAVNLTGLAFTQTLTAVSALAVCFALWLVFHHWWVLRRSGGRLRSLLPLWLGLLAVLAGAGLLTVQSGLGTRLVEMVEEIRQGDWTTATAGRYPVYRITWEMIKDRPWLGHGLNTFGIDFFYYRTEHPVGLNLELIDEPGAFRQVHNDYLQVWFELGGLGLALLLVLAAVPFIKALTGIRHLEDPREVYRQAALCLAVVFVAISCASFFPLRVSATGAYVIFLFACLRHPQRERADAAKPHGGRTGGASHRPLRIDRDWILKLGVVLVVAAAAVYLLVQTWRANTELGLAAMRLTRAQSAELTARQRQFIASEAEQRLERAERLDPHSYGVYSLRGTSALILGRTEDALGYYAKAALYTPSPEAFTNLASAFMARGDDSAARVYTEWALRYNPNHPQALLVLEHLNRKRAP